MKYIFQSIHMFLFANIAISIKKFTYFIFKYFTMSITMLINSLKKRRIKYFPKQYKITNTRKKCHHTYCHICFNICFIFYYRILNYKGHRISLNLNYKDRHTSLMLNCKDHRTSLSKGHHTSLNMDRRISSHTDHHIFSNLSCKDRHISLNLNYKGHRTSLKCSYKDHRISSLECLKDKHLNY